jgi:hypothetical protein
MGTTAPRPVRLKSSSIKSSDTSAKYSWPMTLQKLEIQDSSSSMLADEMLESSEIDSESSSSSSAAPDCCSGSFVARSGSASSLRGRLGMAAVVKVGSGGDARLAEGVSVSRGSLCLGTDRVEEVVR